MAYKNRIVLKSGDAFEFEDEFGNVRQAFLRFLHSPGGGNHLGNQSGANGSDIARYLREVASVITDRK